MNPIDRLKSLNTRDLLIIMVGTGALAGLSGVLTLVDRELFAYKMGFKPSHPRKKTAIRGAFIGGIVALPFMTYTQTGPNALGNLGAPNSVKYNIMNDETRIRDYSKSRFNSLPAAPTNYTYSTDEVGRQLLILDPATGF